MKLYFLRKWKLKFQYERADMKQYQLPAPLLKNISLSICPAICPSLHPSFLPTFHFRVTLAPVMSNHWSLLQNQGFILYTDLSKYEEGLWVLQGEQRTLQGAVGAGGRAGMQRKGFPVGMTAPWKKPSHGQALHLRLWLGCAGGIGGEMCAWGWLGIHNQKCWSGILKKVQLHPEHKIKHAVENFILPRRLLLCTKEGKKKFFTSYVSYSKKPLWAAITSAGAAGAVKCGLGLAMIKHQGEENWCAKSAGFRWFVYVNCYHLVLHIGHCSLSELSHGNLTNQELFRKSLRFPMWSDNISTTPSDFCRQQPHGHAVWEQELTV